MRTVLICTLGLLLFLPVGLAQQALPTSGADGGAAVESDAAPSTLSLIELSRTKSQKFGKLEPRPELSERPGSFEWKDAMRQSAWFLSVQHGFRLLQPKTQRELGGPFFADWAASVEGIHGWGDGDGIVTNYFLHPGEGGIASFIFIQNSPTARRLQFGDGRKYWTSRLKGMAFAAAYSTQFEIGPYSEATIGNVGKKRGTSGYVDFVMTPVGGFAFTVTEDLIDRHVILPIEERGTSTVHMRLWRSLLNPERSIANLLRGQAPWHRDTR